MANAFFFICNLGYFFQALRLCLCSGARGGLTETICFEKTIQFKFQAFKYDIGKTQLPKMSARHSVAACLDERQESEKRKAHFFWLV